MALGKETELPLQLMRRQMVRTVMVIVVSFGLISVLIVSHYADSYFAGSYFLGALLGIANGAVGFVTIEKFIDRDTLVFLKGVFLGMGVRLVLLLGVFVFLMEVVRVNIGGLVAGLLVFYVTMTVLEVIFLNKRIEIRKAMGENRK